MRVLVTGATGLVGGAIVRELLARGHAVTVYARATSDASAAVAAGAAVTRGELLDRVALRAALAGTNAVVHTAGSVDWRRSHRDELFRVNGGGGDAVLGAALEAGVGRAVLTSSTAVLGGTREPVVAPEDAPGNAEALGLPYFLSKRDGERAALALAARGLPVVVVRPSYVLGPGDVHRSSASILVALARRRIPAYVEGGASFCDVRDVARGHAEALERGRAGAIYTLGGHNLAMSEFMARVAALAGVPAPPRVPVAAALAVSALKELVAGLRGRDEPMSRDLVRASALYTWVSSARAERELGYAIRPFDEMVKDTLRWALETGRLEPTTAALRSIMSPA
jgi:dihydroflavonol-4-reductase